MADIFADDFSLGNCNHNCEEEEEEEETEKQPNPFSFSNFVGTQKDFPNNGDAASYKSTEAELNALIGDDGSDGKEENPFSFQNFTPSTAIEGIDKNLQRNKVDESASSSSCDDIDTLNETYESDVEENEHLVKIENLCIENRSLRSELSKVREEFLEYRRTANKRVTNLQKELEKARKKEAEETRDLDNVVRMVEENLRKTTTRATSAESTVTRLKDELKLFKEESITKEKYDALVVEHKCLQRAVQEKSRNVAQLMRTAAEKTEPHVKQLQSGVASLRFFAQQFDDICKVAEVP